MKVSISSLERIYREVLDCMSIDIMMRIRESEVIDLPLDLFAIAMLHTLSDITYLNTAILKYRLN